MISLGKRGFVYVITMSLLLVVILAVFLTTNQYRYQDKTESYHIKISSSNDFVKDLNNDIHRASFIAAFRALISLENHITSSGEFLEDVDKSFIETFYYGTIDGSEVNLMENSSFEEYIQKVNYIGEQKGLNVKVNITTVNLTQSDPWSVDVILTADVNISDKDKLSSWVYTKDYLTNIPILDLRDPLYGVYTKNKIPNTIRKLNVTEFVESGNPENLINHINQSYYIESSFAPTYIMRFENSTEANPNGIESIVNIQTLSDQGLEVFPDRTKIDYIYFNDISDSKICDVEGIPSDLYYVVSDDRDTLYELNELNYSTSC